MSHRSLMRYELNSRQFWLYLEKNGVLSITDINRSCIEEFLLDSKYKKDSIDKDILMLKRLFSFLNTEGYINLEIDFDDVKTSGKTKTRTSTFFAR